MPTYRFYQAKTTRSVEEIQRDQAANAVFRVTVAYPDKPGCKTGELSITQASDEVYALGCSLVSLEVGEKVTLERIR
jgi:hypothetical protein